MDSNFLGPAVPRSQRWYNLPSFIPTSLVQVHWLAQITVGVFLTAYLCIVKHRQQIRSTVCQRNTEHSHKSTETKEPLYELQP